jgi:DNA-binding NarL/FixJ family response regulator
MPTGNIPSLKTSRRISRVVAPTDPVASLTDREWQVLRLLAVGRALGDIARELNLSMKTVGTHRERLKDKLGVDDARALERVADELLRAGRL